MRSLAAAIMSWAFVAVVADNESAPQYHTAPTREACEEARRLLEEATQPARVAYDFPYGQVYTSACYPTRE